ncbi:MAG: TadE/TadG family type IV pilus assembly protein [Pseudomonadota bacterium]
MKRVLSSWSRLWSAIGGSTAINFALIVIPLMACVGLAVDGSRAFLVKYRFQSSLDTAALAIGTTFGSQTYLEEMAEKYVANNFNMSGTTIQNIALSSSAEQVIVSGSVKMDTFFMQIIGADNVVINATTDVRRAGGGLMVSLVLDNTGSMWGSAGGGTSRIEALRSASESLVDALFQEETDTDDLKVGVVPYAAMVNPGDEAPNIVDSFVSSDFRITDPQSRTGVDADDLDVLTYDPSDKTQWKGCVFERAGADSMADTPPTGTKKWTPLIWPVYNDNDYEVYTSGVDLGEIDADTVDPGGDRNTNAFTGPNVGCPTPITPLTGTKASITNALSEMTAWNRGGTLSDIGMAWGIRTLSPGDPFDQSATFTDPKTGEVIWDSPRWRRAIVLMTDGDNQIYDAGNVSARVQDVDELSDVTAYGRLGEEMMDDLFGTSNRNAAVAKVDDRLAELCEDAKELEIVIYTVVFSNSPDEDTKALFQTCASDAGKYWFAPDADALDSAFGAIGADLNKLRITR